MQNKGFAQQYPTERPFKRYEDASVSYAGVPKHDGIKIALLIRS